MNTAQKGPSTRIAVVGATGLVGSTMATVLQEHGYGACTFIPAASSRSRGKTVRYGGHDVPVVSIEEALAARPQIALFAAGGDVSRQWAERFADAGARVVDNSSAWRMVEGVPLVVPEVNPDALEEHHRIIANPNCSTIQLVAVLAPLHQHFGLEMVHISTYQSVSGSGMRGIHQLEAERAGQTPLENRAYAHSIDLNCLPQCDDFLENGYTKEEMKLANESRKIMGLPHLRASATAVRVPVWGGHSEAVSALFERAVSPAEAREILMQAPGVRVLDDPAAGLYPMAREAHGKDDVFVGRIREDLANPERGLNLWIVADNIRKGAATNAVQIVDLIAARWLR